jgi:hypothetical protein
MLVRAASRSRRSGAFRLIVTRARLADNWLLNPRIARGAAILSLHGWETLTDLPAAAMVAHAIVLSRIPRRGDMDPRDLLHEETRGCVFDFVRAKSGIALKLMRPSICTSCRDALSRGGIPVEPILRGYGAVTRIIGEEA